MVNSKQKGARGEREFANFLRGMGFNARRGQQYSGGDGSPDVVTDVENVHFEVKRTERFDPYKAYEQAMRDVANGSKYNDIAVVAHKKNNENWMVFLSAYDFLNIVRHMRRLEKEKEYGF